MVQSAFRGNVKKQSGNVTDYNEIGDFPIWDDAEKKRVCVIGELAPLLSVLGTKCISATNPRRAESPDLDPVAMHYLVLFLISFCSVSASSQLVKTP
jgi:hypothetical protein